MTRSAPRTYDQLTVRVGPEVARRLRALAKAQRVSVSRVVDETLRAGVGLGPEDGKPRPVGSALDWLVGTLSDDDARAILDAASTHEQIDTEYWAAPVPDATTRPRRRRKAGAPATTTPIRKSAR